MSGSRRKAVVRQDDRVILHFDYDCFYAAVFEAENPALHSLPLAVQQKQIIVTCNYEARRRGLRKLQLITEAKQKCPDLIIMLGEDLTRFRNASKMLYDHLRSFVWSHRAERLGFDEVFLDVTDMVAYNVELLNYGDLTNCFFHMSRDDPTIGFAYDASHVNGHTWPGNLLSPPSLLLGVPAAEDSQGAALYSRLVVGSHLAKHLRHKIEEDKGYTSTIGISTNKLLAKLIGNVHKPKGQTTLLPQFTAEGGYASAFATSCAAFVGQHEVGRIPGIGFKLGNKIREHVLGRAAQFEGGLLYGITKENVRVSDVLSVPEIGPELLDKICGGIGAPQDIGSQVWGLLNAIDPAEVALGRKVPRQISIEDSYIRLNTLEQVRIELLMLSNSLLKRMHVDLVEEAEDHDDQGGETAPTVEESQSKSNGMTYPSRRRWIAHPRTLRISTRPRPPLNLDGTRTRSFNRISRSIPVPHFIFSLTYTDDVIVEKLVHEVLLPQFRKLHPEKRGWDLSLVNLAVTNMVEVASETADTASGAERNIESMFRRQDSTLKPWKVEDRDVPPDNIADSPETPHEGRDQPHDHDGHADSRIAMNQNAFDQKGSEDHLVPTQDSRIEHDADWADEENIMTVGECCPVCGAVMPAFAMAAHERYHQMGD